MVELPQDVLQELKDAGHDTGAWAGWKVTEVGTHCMQPTAFAAKLGELAEEGQTGLALQALRIAEHLPG
eukprot:11168093-Prorocentrum_lima.AAC.1